MKKITVLSVVFSFFIFAFSFGQTTSDTHFTSRSITGIKRFFGTGAHHIYLPSQDYHFKNILTRQKQKLDSIVVSDTDDPEDNEKLTFHYDALGNLIDYTYWEIADAGGWEMDVKFTFSYNTTGKMDSLFLFAPDSLGNLEPDVQEVFTYSNGKLDRVVALYYDTDSLQWLEDQKDVFTYDSSGRLAEKVDYYNSTNQTINKTSAVWTKNEKTTWSYDDKGSIATITDYDWDSGQWVADGKDEYSFSDGKLTGDVYSYWDSNSGAWSDDNKYVYSYDNQGRFVQEIDYSAHSEKGSGEWTNQSKTEIQYDTDGNFATETDFDWNESAGQWSNSEKSELKYDNTYSFSDLVLPAYILSDLGRRGGHSSDKSAAQSEKTNDSFDPAESFIPSPADFRMYFVHMWTSSIDYDWDAKIGSWTKSEKIALFYSKFDVTGVRKTEEQHLEIQPNPASGYITVTLPRQDVRNFTFELFDVQGRKVLSEKVANHARINLQYLQNGVYFYRAVFRGEKFSGKILKK